ncbi:DUF5325 family protein [Paenibacillus rigui]|uniref:Uncharacterized protein n=1 Tax=Paenibacillus rigui TaxID=554312 RepID=A0A229UUM4_9BACL|nr:DUF5325 family protein [Paenibacillus rigui]OXM87080.1 hypothetical protein CF651_05315 [Paenibacillus rigui]
MNKGLALLFAIVGTLLLAGISLGLSLGNLWLVIFFTLASIGFIGFGFVVKAKQRRRREEEERNSPQ